MMTATFACDFTQFDTAVRNAQVTLKGFEGNANQVEKSLNRMTDSFSGRRMISEATLMAEAIERAGGVTTLTGNELQRAGAKAAEAAEKMRALGVDVPPGIQKLADTTKDVSAATQQATGDTGLMSKAFTSFFGALTAQQAVSFIIGQLKEVAAESFRVSDALVNMEAKTGINITALYGLKYAADQSGSSLEAVVNASIILSERIGSGSTSTVAAIEKLGLNFDLLKRQSPEQELIAVIGALANIGTRSEQASLANDILGKSYKEMLGLANQGFNDLSKNAPQASETATRAMEGMGDVWGKFWATNNVNVTNAVGLWASLILSGPSAFKDALLEIAGLKVDYPLPPTPPGLRTGITDITLSLAEQKRIEDELTNSAKTLGAEMEKAEKESIIWGDGIYDLATDMQNFDEETKKAGVDVKAMSAIMKGFVADLEPLSSAFGSAWGEMQKYSLDALKKIADEAEMTYSYVLANSSQYKAGAVEHFRQVAEAARASASGITSSFQSAGAASAAAIGSAAVMINGSWASMKQSSEVLQATESGELIIIGQTAAEHAKAGAAAVAATGAATAGYLSLGTQIQIDGDAIRAWIELMQYTDAANAIFAQNGLFITQSQRDQIAALHVPSFAGGVENFGGGVARVHQDELLVNLPRGTDVIPAGRAGSGLTINGGIHISSVMGNPAEIARVVKSALVDAARASGQRLSA